MQQISLNELNNINGGIFELVRQPTLRSDGFFLTLRNNPDDDSALCTDELMQALVNSGMPERHIESFLISLEWKVNNPEYNKEFNASVGKNGWNIYPPLSEEFRNSIWFKR